MYIAFFECVAIVWIYGTKRMSANIKDMTGSYPNFIFRLLWQYISPLLILGLWFFSVTDYKEPTYNKGSYIYPPWAIILGWCIAGTSLAPIPLMAIIRILTAKANSLYAVSKISVFNFELILIWKNLLQKFKKSLQTTIETCPCGCEIGLDENHEAHSSQLSLIKRGGCDQESFDDFAPPILLKKSPLDPEITKC